MGFTAIDLFCGAGGMSTALRGKFDVQCSVEYDEIIAKTYEKNHKPRRLIIEDIKKIPKKRWTKLVKLNPGELDLLIGTPPCQGFSKHSRKKSSENLDKRNELIFQVLNVASYFRPKFVLFENVGNILNFDLFYYLLQKLSNINEDGYPIKKTKPSYHIRFEVVNAKDFNVPQRRKRLILLAKKIEPSAFPIPDAFINRNKKGIPQVKLALELWPERTQSPKLGDFLKNYKLSPIKAGETDEKDKLHTARALSDLNIKRIEATPKNGGSRNSWPIELWLECHKKKNVSFGDVYGRMNFFDYSPTITCGCNSLSKGRFGHPVENRAISLREAALIQTFPDEYEFHGSRENQAQQIGNAVPVNLAKAFVDVIYDELLKV